MYNVKLTSTQNRFSSEIIILQFGDLEGNREVNGEVAAPRTEN